MLFYIPGRNGPGSVGPPHHWSCWDIQYVAAQNATTFTITITAKITLKNTPRNTASHEETECKFVCKGEIYVN